jgi:hypothetical protein
LSNTVPADILQQLNVTVFVRPDDPGKPIRLMQAYRPVAFKPSHHLDSDVHKKEFTRLSHPDCPIVVRIRKEIQTLYSVDGTPVENRFKLDFVYAMSANTCNTKSKEIRIPFQELTRVRRLHVTSEKQSAPNRQTRHFSVRVINH